MNPRQSGTSGAQASRVEHESDIWPLECPVCQRELARFADTLRCSSGHAFDLAREGYANLLVPQHRARGIHGDTRVMLAARRRFLDTGWYAPLLEAICEVVDDAIQTGSNTGESDPDRACVLEAGCGEGYFVGGVARTLGRPASVFLGMDVSKEAARLAARRYCEAMFVVADTKRRLYVGDATIDVLLDIFAPRNPAEFERVVRSGGVVLVTVPSASHLQTLRSELGLLGIEQEKEERVRDGFAGGFALVDRVQISYPLELPADAVLNLVGMGPNAWHDSSRSVDAAEGLFSTEAAFTLLRFRRRSGPVV